MVRNSWFTWWNLVVSYPIEVVTKYELLGEGIPVWAMVSMCESNSAAHIWFKGLVWTHNVRCGSQGDCILWRGRRVLQCISPESQATTRRPDEKVLPQHNIRKSQTSQTRTTLRIPQHQSREHPNTIHWLWSLNSQSQLQNTGLNFVLAPLTISKDTKITLQLTLQFLQNRLSQQQSTS